MEYYSVSIHYSKHAFVGERYNHCIRERATWTKRECLFNECWMNIMLTWDLFPFSSLIGLRISISSVALLSNTSAACFEFQLTNLSAVNTSIAYSRLHLPMNQIVSFHSSTVLAPYIQYRLNIVFGMLTRTCGKKNEIVGRVMSIISIIAYSTGCSVPRWLSQKSVQTL